MAAAVCSVSQKVSKRSKIVVSSHSDTLTHKNYNVASEFEKMDDPTLNGLLFSAYSSRSVKTELLSRLNPPSEIFLANNKDPTLN